LVTRASAPRDKAAAWFDSGGQTSLGQTRNEWQRAANLRTSVTKSSARYRETHAGEADPDPLQEIETQRTENVRK
jgi:hypothetical protein